METLEDRVSGDSVRGQRPVVVIAFCGGHPTFAWLAVGGHPLRIGRDTHPGLELDARMSREHVEIQWHDGEWTIRDCGSRNGTFVDGVALERPHVGAAPRVIRAGQTVLLPVDDGMATAMARKVQQAAQVVGVRLQGALADLARAAEAGANALILGESGSGKELAAASFHASGPNRKGPLVAVNCATIPLGLAESLLFGARRGAFSGASADSDGYIRAADGGVLFLDEVGELELDVQAKLLRVLGTCEVTPLGATRASKVNVRYCFATHRDLRARVEERKFRADLYYRLAQPAIALPPLRDRLEEIPWHLAAEISAVDATLSISAELVEACMLRPWPGNIRELRAEARRMAFAARTTRSRVLRPAGLSPLAGAALVASHVAPAPAPSVPPPPAVTPAPPAPAPADRREPVTRERIEEAFRLHGGPTAVAQALGIHRSHLHRLMKQLGVVRPEGNGDEDG
jgi:transcriptional regulator with GAF, ATPase, and Fis domain